MASMTGVCTVGESTRKPGRRRQACHLSSLTLRPTHAAPPTSCQATKCDAVMTFYSYTFEVATKCDASSTF